MATHYDPLFKGCTRPPMLFGVPLYPLVFVSAVFVLLSAWISFFLAPFLLPIALIMRLLARQDDQMFRLLWLKLQFRIFHPNRNKVLWNASSYSPFRFGRRE